MRLHSWIGLGCVAIAIASACGDEGEGADPCTPGAQVACACPGGQSGIQVCNGRGTGYEACACANGADSGVSTGDPKDAATDRAAEPTGPVAVGLVPAGAGGITGMVVEGDAVIVAIAATSGPDGVVVSVPTRGGDVTTLATAPLANSVWQTGSLVAASATDVFFVTVTSGGGTNTFDIKKKARNGSGSVTTFIADVGSVSTLQVADGFLYWAANGGLRRSPVGSAANSSVAGAASFDFVVVGANVYFGAGASPTRIDRVATTGGAASTVVADAKSPLLSLTADPTGAMFVYHDYSPNSSIYRAPVAGAPAGLLVTAAPNDAIETPRIATDGTRIYYVSNKVLKSIGVGGGTVAELVTNQDPLWVTSASQHVYWYNRTDKSVWRMRKP